MEYIELNEILDTIQGSQFPIEEQELQCKDGYKRFLRISDYTKSNEPERYVKYSGKELVCTENDVVVVRYGNVGFIGMGKSGILANNLFALKVKSDLILNRYLYYFLNSKKINLSLIRKANSSTMPALTHKMIKELKMPLIDKNEQKIVIEKLDKILSIIEIRKKQIEIIDDIVKSQFVEHNIFNELGGA